VFIRYFFLLPYRAKAISLYKSFLESKKDILPLNRTSFYGKISKYNQSNEKESIKIKDPAEN